MPEAWRHRWRHAALLAHPYRVPLRTLTVAVLVALVWWFLSAEAVRHGFFDLRVYYGAINSWAHGGGLYDYLSPHTRYGFTYPPFAALAMAPMALVSWHVAIAVSVVATAAATLALLYLFVAPVARRHGWSRLFVLAVVAALVAAFEPMRETMNFGQVNMLLLFLVVGDILLLVRPGRPAGGIGIGLATAIKLTPAVFIVYLLVTRRWRAGGLATAVAAVATLAAAVIAPDTSRVFFTEALLDTNRIGTLSFISNQSLQGAVARLNPAAPNTLLWLALVAAVLAFWLVRVRRAAANGDEKGGVALTGVLACLVSPVTWVHHLVWLLPALLLLAERGYPARAPMRATRLVAAIGLYVLLSSRLVWDYAFHFGGWGLLGSNAYVLASLVLLAGTPLSRGEAAAAGSGPPRGITDLGEVDGVAAGRAQGVHAGGAVRRESETFVEPARPRVVGKHP